MFNPAKSAASIRDEYIDYITTTFHFQDSNLENQFRKQLNNRITKGPFIDINSAFEKGKTREDLIQEGVVSPLFRKLEEKKQSKYKKEIPLNRRLYLHQEQAIRLIVSGQNAVITTGTGSGKTECFLYPILNDLLCEQEQGTLSTPGIRAILIYPRNALANDQMKRLRKILMDYPSIRFGIFTGDTVWNDDNNPQGRYKEIHSQENYEELRKPLENEVLTREERSSNPPHIICTNYSRLERLLLAPNRSSVFNNAKLKFVVLDEAHTYSGSTGMETAWLLRRFVARVCEKQKKPQFILTSATLGRKGQSEEGIIHFATSLTGAKFTFRSIIFGRREKVTFSDSGRNYPPKIFFEILHCEEESIKAVFEEYQIPYDESKSEAENLYELCFSSSYYHRLKQYYHEPLSLNDLASQIVGLSECDAISFLSVCSKANKNGSPLLDRRYHFFVRALEGVYRALTGNHELFLDRKEWIRRDSADDRVFEITMCKNCGDLAIIGKINKEHGREFLTSRDKEERNSDDFLHFHIVNSDDKDSYVDAVDQQECSEDDLDVSEYDEDFNPLDGASHQVTEDYWLCPHCGELSLAEDGKPDCGHDGFIKVRCLKQASKKKSDRCLRCYSGTYNQFYLGTEAATGVLATALFEELPIVKIHQEQEDGYDEEFEAGKQFLVFSDSRSDAAYFATYLDRTYRFRIEKRRLVTLLERERESIIHSSVPWTLSEYADKLARLFVENNSFLENLLIEPNPRNLERESKLAAWKVILKELVTSKRNGSLQSLGFLRFQYLGNSEKIVKAFKEKYFPNLTLDDVKNLLDELARTFAYFGAIKAPKEFGVEDRKAVFWSERQKAIAKVKEGKTNPCVSNWLPRQKSNGGFYKTYRQQLVLRALGTEDFQKANEILDVYFDKVLIRYNAESKGGYFLLPEAFTILVPGCNGAKWYRCDRCHKITTVDIAGKCPIEKCSGHLKELFDYCSYPKNHYANFYENEKGQKYRKKLLIKEHTAQLSKKDAAEYQNQFEKNNINALSCSTTFEMGVDVGQLETVFLRDIPPSPANYVQRAGRAGRSKDASAFVLSFARLSSHDFNFYENPINRISGVIEPPYFKIDNQKILYRHIYSAVLGYFFECNGQYFNKNHYSAFLTGAPRGFDVFLDRMKHPPLELKKRLHSAFCDVDSEFGISDFSSDWVDELIGENGRLSLAVREFDTNRGELEQRFLAAKNDATDCESLEKAKRVLANKTRLGDGDLINFLVQANVLPKYGFPVDTVELKTERYVSSGDSCLRLTRDRSMAISDYAPGSKIIANNQRYTSRYVLSYYRGAVKDFDHYYVSQCSHNDCKTMNVSLFNPTDQDERRCKGCNRPMKKNTWYEAIAPSAGRQCQRAKNGALDAEAVPLKRPKKIYRSDFHFVEEDKDRFSTEIKIGARIITLISSSKDRIIVTSAKPIYVCPKCGYAYGYYDVIKNDKGKPDKEAMKNRKAGTLKTMTISNSHLQSSGYPCIGHEFKREYLYHSFNSDIVQIVFNGCANIPLSQGLSVLYALIDATSHILQIEEDEISGVFQRQYSPNLGTDYHFILFDNVSGGAGYVKQLVQGDVLKKVINYAFSKMKNCSCDSSCYNCLRTYQNQSAHNLLSRKEAEDFLSSYVTEEKLKS